MVKTLNLIAQAIFDKKGFNIIVLDVQNVCTLTDYLIIAEGNVDRHVQAIANFLISKLKDIDIFPIRVEGEDLGDWIILDYGDFMVHLFTPDMREKYRLEQLWKEAKIVDVKIEILNKDK